MRLPAYALEKSDKPSALDTPKDVCAKSHRPMPKRDSLITRLRNIGTSLEQSKKALALIGLGSVGVESQRLDDFSDLDFFAVVQTGAKAEFLGSTAISSQRAGVPAASARPKAPSPFQDFNPL